MRLFNTTMTLKAKSGRKNLIIGYVYVDIHPVHDPYIPTQPAAHIGVSEQNVTSSLNMNFYLQRRRKYGVRHTSSPLFSFSFPFSTLPRRTSKIQNPS